MASENLPSSRRRSTLANGEAAGVVVASGGGAGADCGNAVGTKNPASKNAREIRTERMRWAFPPKEPLLERNNRIRTNSSSSSRALRVQGGSPGLRARGFAKTSCRIPSAPPRRYLGPAGIAKSNSFILHKRAGWRSIREIVFGRQILEVAGRMTREPSQGRQPQTGIWTKLDRG